MLVSLEEFSFGFNRWRQILANPPESAIVRFYTNCLYQYCGNYFLGTGHKLKDNLAQLGCEDLLKEINEVLKAKLGRTTLGEIVKHFRDKFLTHQTFLFGPLEDKVHKKFDLDKPENILLFTDLAFRLLSLTDELYRSLLQRYPEASLGG